MTTYHKSERWDDSYMRGTCQRFYRGDIYLQGTILWRILPCQETAGNDGQTLDPVQLQVPLERYDKAHHALKLWKGSLLNNNLTHERG